MKEPTSILMAILTLIAGMIGGGTLAAHFYNRQMEAYIASASFEGISDRYAVLQTLRAGNTNQAAAFLEQQMDGQILLYAGMKSDVPVASLERSDIRLLLRVRDYRTIHHYIGDGGDVDHTVASILSLTNKNVWPDATPSAPVKK